MRRRDFIKVVAGSASTWPLAARAQQPAMPVVGFLDPASPESQDYVVAPLRDGLKQAGYVEGENVVIEYRWAEGKYNRLPELAADLVTRRVNVIATGPSTPAALAAKAATKEIPIVFIVAEDPVIRNQSCRCDSSGGRLRRANPQRRKAGRPTRGAVD
jgi:putative ABC transport system substrate-binding protein